MTMLGVKFQGIQPISISLLSLSRFGAITATQPPKHALYPLHKARMEAETRYLLMKDFLTPGLIAKMKKDWQRKGLPQKTAGEFVDVIVQSVHQGQSLADLRQEWRKAENAYKNYAISHLDEILRYAKPVEQHFYRIICRRQKALKNPDSKQYKTIMCRVKAEGELFPKPETMAFWHRFIQLGKEIFFLEALRQIATAESRTRRFSSFPSSEPR